MSRTALAELENILLMHFGALPRAKAHGEYTVSVETSTGPVKEVAAKELIRVFDLLPEAIREAKALKQRIYKSELDEE